ncbi:MAG: Hsp20/alpha crystallin family protein [Promethearchaeota archaeon]
MCDEKHHGTQVWANCCSPRDIARMKHMAGRFMRHFVGGFGSWVPHNVEDLGNEYLITVPLPGRTKEDVQVSIINKNLNVSAKKPKVPEKEGAQKEEEKDFPFPFYGFKFVDVNMDIPLPADANEDMISSKMANGLLRITVGKKPAKHIDINESQN